MKMKKIKIYLVLLSVILSSNLWAALYFVTPQGNGNKSGDSWGNAMSSGEFSLKLISASQGDEFYLSQGNYIPTLDKTGTASLTGTQTFRLLPGVSIYGSYKAGLMGTAKAETDRELKNADGELSPSTASTGVSIFGFANSPSTSDESGSLFVPLNLKYMSLFLYFLGILIGMFIVSPGGILLPNCEELPTSLVIGVL